MSLIWMDGFDHYGTSLSIMQDGAWAEISSTLGISISATGARTGSYGLRRIASANNPQSADIARRVLGAVRQTVGVGAAVYMTALPSETKKIGLFGFLTAAGLQQLTIWIETTGDIVVSRAGHSISTPAVELGRSNTQPLVAGGSHQFVEARVYFHETEGTVEVRVDGVTVLDLSGVDTIAYASEVGASQIVLWPRVDWDSSSWLGEGGMTVDDLFAWDDSGTVNNDFLGDRRVRTLFPDADTAQADWTPTGAASGYDCIDDAAPNDDTDYLLAEPLTGSPLDPLVSEFELPTPVAETSIISAIQTYTRMVKTEAGEANVQVSLVSGVDVDDGSDRPITTQYTYWTDVFEIDPATGAPWTVDGLAAAQLRIARTV